MRWLILIIALLILLNVIYINDDIKKIKALLSTKTEKKEQKQSEKEIEDFIEEV